MDLNNVKEKIIIARKAVEDEEEPYKTAAFQVILGKLLDSEQTELGHSKILPEKTKSISSSINGQTIDLDKRKEELAKNCGITVKELNDIISTKDGVIQVIYPLAGKESDKQIIATQCILVAYDVLFGREFIDSSLLRKCIDYSGIGSLNHLAENLKESPNLFRASGKGTRLDYRLTGPGRKSAFEIIKKMSKGEKL